MSDKIKFDKRNYRKHNDRNKELINKSLKECGAGRSIVIDNEDNIIAGNGIYEQAQKLGLKTKVIETDGSELVVVKRTDLATDDDKRKQLAVMDNSTSDSSEFDFELLQADFEVDTLGDWGIDADFEIEEEEKEVVEDEVPEEVETRCKLGDIWQLGSHRLMCGDSTKVDDVEKLMNGEKADMVFTDPPYGYEYQSNFREKTDKFDKLKNDDKILDFFPLLQSYLKGWIFICTTWKVLSKWLPLFTKHYNLSNMIIWSKGGGGLGDLEHTFSTDYEIILVSNNNAKITGKRLGSVWDITRDDVNAYKHPTQKPVKLPAEAIENVTLKNNIVLDLFGGSGSTLIACEQLNRKCYTMELDEHYCDVIITRWENLTGKKAELING